MTALENVATPLELAGTPDAFGRAEEELAAVGLDHRMHHYPSQMSGVNSNAWHWPAPLPRAPKSCWLMNQPETLMVQRGCNHGSAVWAA